MHLSTARVCREWHFLVAVMQKCNGKLYRLTLNCNILLDRMELQGNRWFGSTAKADPSAPPRTSRKWKLPAHFLENCKSSFIAGRNVGNCGEPSSLSNKNCADHSCYRSHDFICQQIRKNFLDNIRDNLKLHHFCRDSKFSPSSHNNALTIISKWNCC